MFRITEDPSSGSLVQCLSKITRMVLSYPLIWMWSVLEQHIVTRCVCVCVCVCSSLFRKTLLSAFLDGELHTHTHRVTIRCHYTDHVQVNRHDRTILDILAKFCTRLPDDGSFVIRNMLEHF